MKKKKKALVVLACGAVLVVVLLVLLLRPRYTVLIPNEYVRVTSKGLNGSGTAKLAFDRESFEREITAEQNLKPAQQSELESLLVQAEGYFSLSQEKELSNGDKIAIQSVMPSDYLKEYHIKIENSDYYYTVSGLTEVQKVNLADYCTLEFSGFEQHGYASYYLDSEKLVSEVGDMVRKADDSENAEAYISGEMTDDLFYSGLYALSLSPAENLSNGDTVTLTCEISDADTSLVQYGIVFEGSSLDVEAEGLAPVETLDLEPYIQVSFQGYDGYGKAYFSLDEEKLGQDLVEQFPEGRGYHSAEELGAQVASYADDAMYQSLMPQEGLSNGEEVQIRLAGEGEENYAGQVGFLLADVEKTVTVEGLAPVETVSFDEYVSVAFSGFEGDGNAQAFVDYDKLEADLVARFAGGRGEYSAQEVATRVRNLTDWAFDLEVEPASGLSNGEEVSLRFSAASQEQYLSDIGIRLEDLERIETTEGLTGVDVWNLADYLSVRVSGYDRVGTAEVSFDYEKLEGDLAGQYAQGRGGYDLETVIWEVKDQLDWEFDWSAAPTSGLSNGDVVTAKIGAEEAPIYLSDLGISLEGGECRTEVQSLEKQTEVDLMDIVEVSFSGITPNVQVQVAVDEDSPLSAFLDWDSIWEIPESLFAYNGGELEVTVAYDSDRALHSGYTVINNTKTYEITGLDTYDFPLESTEEEALASLISDQKEEILPLLLWNRDTLLETLGEDYVQILWSRIQSGLERIVKLYAPDSYSDHNRLALVYRADIPLMQPDESISVGTVYLLRVMENVSEGQNGLAWEEETADYFYLSWDSAGEAIESLAQETWEEVSFQRTEVVNGDLEAELKKEEEETEESASEAESETEEPEGAADRTPPERPSAAAPEISQSAGAAASVELEGHRYYLFDEPVTWKEAEQLCEREGGTLASVTSWPEQAVLQTLMEQGALEHYWIGASDAAAEGDWTWTTGELFTYTCWDDGQPDNTDGTEHYAVISKEFDNHWNDYPEEKEGVGYILEVSSQEEPEGTYLVSEGRILTHSETASREACVLDTYGNSHYGAILFQASEHNWVEYETDGAYRWLSGEVSVGDGADSGVCMDIAVFGDGELLWSRCGMTRQTNPVSFTVDVSGVRRLTVETGSSGASGEGLLILDGARLYPEEESSDERTERLAGTYLIDSWEMYREQRLGRDTDGVLHDGSLMFDTQEESYAVWNLAEAYSTFSGRFATFEATGAGASMGVRIYGDGELLFEEKEISKASGGAEFSVPVEGVKTLRVETENASEEGGDGWLYLVDDALTESGAEKGSGTEEKEDAAVGTESAFSVVPANVTALASASAEYPGHKYFLIEAPATWKSAFAFCGQMGGRLAVADAPLAQARIQALLEYADGNGYWLGASDEVREGEWVWVNGDALTYENWDDGQPDNYDSEEGGENYLMVYGDGTWNDAAEKESYGFIMEFVGEDADRSGERELAALPLAGEDCEYSWRVRDVNEEAHLSGYRLDADEGAWMSAGLNGAYASIRGTILPARGSSQDAVMSVALFGDGRLLYSATEISGWSGGIPFEADVTGVKTLTVRTANTGEGGALLLCDAVLSEALEPSLSGRAASLADLQLIDSADAEHHARLFRDTYGNSYDGDWCFEASADGYGVYLLDGAYTELDFVAAASRATSSESSMALKIYGDEELLFDMGGITRLTEPELYTLDVTGVQNLKIVTDDVEGAYDGYLYVTGDALR